MYKGTEVRACRRINLLGTTISYKQKKRLFSGKASGEENCPILDMSRGGLRFVSDKYLKINSKIYLELLFPDVKEPLILFGRVRWTSINPGKSYKYQIGVQFDPFGERKGFNSPHCLAKIVTVEKKALQA